MNTFHVPYGFRQSGNYTISFFETDIDVLTNELLSWGAEHCWSYHITPVPEQFLKEKQFDTVDHLARTSILIPTMSYWTAMVDNAKLASTPHSTLVVMTERLKIHAVSFTFDSIEQSKSNNRPFGISFEYFDGRHGGKAAVRHATLIRDSKWEFDQYGTPLQFEQLDKYEIKLKRERLSPEMLIEYANALGIDISNPDFYRIEEAQQAVKYLTENEENYTQNLLQQLTDIGKEFGAKNFSFFKGRKRDL